jgi:hypothetical protein
MPISLREAWTSAIAAGDYETHMAAVGQAQANAALVAELLRERPPEPGSELLIAGAGTGQMFDYLDCALLHPFRATFTDVNAAFLERLAARLRRSHLRFNTVVDDIEASALAGRYALALVVLVLEHVDWRRAVGVLCGLASRVFVVIQENPPGAGMLLRTPGTLAVLREASPQSIARAELEAAFARLGFAAARTSALPVNDGKRMRAIEFAGPHAAELR